MQRGFMLIELVLVIAIIAIAAALVFPQIGDWIAAYDLNIAARQLAADLRLLQQLSINSDGVFPILHLRVTSPYGYYTDLRTKVIQPTRTCPKTIKVSGTATTVTFNINGLPVQGTDMTIALARVDGKGTKLIIIQAQTGRVRIE